MSFSTGYSRGGAYGGGRVNSSNSWSSSWSTASSNTVVGGGGGMSSGSGMFIGGGNMGGGGMSGGGFAASGGGWATATASAGYSTAVEGVYVRNYASLSATGMSPDFPDDFSDNEKTILKVEKVDYLIQANVVQHNTDEYNITTPGQFKSPELVIRRGQPFDVQVTLNREFETGKDDLKLLFEIGEKPIPSKGTRVEILMSDRDEPGQWGAKIKSIDGLTLVFTILIPPTCFVGKWAISIDTKRQGVNTSLRHRNRDVYIIFNPWCRDDPVYMPESEDREEYVMNDTGVIFAGSEKSIGERKWNFAQFDDWVLECAVKLLDKSGLGWTARGDPIKIVRKLSSICNSIDNQGVIAGNWSGDYAGGNSPLNWTGSQKILKNFYLMEQTVNYGQCWVFSGVMTSLCRTLGIPTRSITNFTSAHDSDGSITVDSYFSKEGKPLEELNDDSVWNFHVWNEVWMARPDLPVGYGGWQVVDATPQETSEGICCCGPASLVAIKKGEVNLPYDGGFVFAEINADHVYWIKQTDSSWRKILNKQSIGKSISTKKKGDTFEREDVTHLYKHKEGSSAERAAVLNAQKCNTSVVPLERGSAYTTGTEDVVFKFADIDTLKYGESFSVTIDVSNTSRKTRTIDANLYAAAVTSKGVRGVIIKESQSQLTLTSNAKGKLSLEIDRNDYRDECYEHSMVHISCLATVKETNQVFYGEDDFVLSKPKLEITCNDTVIVGGELNVTFSFTNPLDETLNKCMLEWAGAGFMEIEPKKMSTVPANGEFLYQATVQAPRPGRYGTNRHLLAKFTCKEMDDIDGQKSIKVLSA